MNYDINQLLEIYLGVDSDGGFQPVGCEERLIRAFPKDSSEIRLLMSRYLDEDHSPDWSKYNLAEETVRFADALKRKFPELSIRTNRALANRWSYNNK